MASKEKNSQNGYRTSLIPVIESTEQQLRTEMDQARRQVDIRIQEAKKRAGEKIQEGRLGVLEHVEQKRKKGLTELRKQAEQLSQSSMKHDMHLRKQIQKNMARAVQTVVFTVTGMGEQT